MLGLYLVNIRSQLSTPKLTTEQPPQLTEKTSMSPASLLNLSKVFGAQMTMEEGLRKSIGTPQARQRRAHWPSRRWARDKRSTAISYFITVVSVVWKEAAPTRQANQHSSSLRIHFRRAGHRPPNSPPRASKTPRAGQGPLLRYVAAQPLPRCRGKAIAQGVNQIDSQHSHAFSSRPWNPTGCFSAIFQQGSFRTILETLQASPDLFAQDQQCRPHG